MTYDALRQQPRVNLAASVPLPIPLSIYIEPTNVCGEFLKRAEQI